MIWVFVVGFLTAIGGIFVFFRNPSAPNRGIRPIHVPGDDCPVSPENEIPRGSLKSSLSSPRLSVGDDSALLPVPLTTGGSGGLVLRLNTESHTESSEISDDPEKSMDLGIARILTPADLDTPQIEALLGQRFGHYFKPFRPRKETTDGRTKDFSGRQDLLRYRQWLPPAVVYRKGTGEEWEVVLSPPSVDDLLAAVLPMDDPRYYRVYKEISFNLCQRLAKKMETYVQDMEGRYEDLPVFSVIFDAKGKIVSKKFKDTIGPAIPTISPLLEEEIKILSDSKISLREGRKGKAPLSLEGGGSSE